MIRTFKPRMDILPSAQRRLWPALRQARDLGFVLYGGTAIALRQGHRHSVDFDFFTAKSLNKANLREVFDFIGRATVLQDDPHSLTLLVDDDGDENGNVKVSFFGNIGHGRVGDPEQTDDSILLVASMDDLMATKVKVILQRIEAKDYLDIAALLKAGISLECGLAAARLLYGKQFQPSEALKAMVYFEGGDLATLPEAAKVTLIEAASAVRDLPVVELASTELV